MDSIQLITVFLEYIEEWRDLERKYYQIPSWRWLKQLNNIKEREHLTRVFVARMKHRGVIQ